MTRGPLQDAQGADYLQRQNENMQQLEEQIRHDTLGGMKARQIPISFVISGTGIFLSKISVKMDIMYQCLQSHSRPMPLVCSLC
jgi:hypothetical protein